MESSLLLGYERYFLGVPAGFGRIGYTAFFESESLYRFTRRARFFASAMVNTKRALYGFEFGGSYSYVVTGGVKMAMVRNLPLTQTWRFLVNPFIGIDIWFASLHIGYNLQAESKPRLALPPPAVGRLSYSINVYIPLRKNKEMYR